MPLDPWMFPAVLSVAGCAALVALMCAPWVADLADELLRWLEVGRVMRSTRRAARRHLRDMRRR